MLHRTKYASLVAAFVSSVCVPETSWAQRVEVILAATEPAASALQRSLAELFERIGLEGHLSRAPRILRSDLRLLGATPDLVARTWIDATRRERCVVVVADPRSERVLVRRIPLSDGFDEIAREAVAHIVQDTVDALRRGQRIGIPHDEAVAAVEDEAPVARSSHPAPATQGSSARWALRGVLGWVLGPWAEPSRATHGPELSLRWWPDRHGRVAVVLEAGARLPSAWSTARVTLSLTPLSLRAGMGYEWLLTSRWSLEASASVGVDAVVLSARAATPAVIIDAAPLDLRPVLRTQLGLNHRFGRGGTLGIAVLADVDWTSTDYHLERGTERERIATPWHVRPAMRVAVGWDGRP